MGLVLLSSLLGGLLASLLDSLLDSLLGLLASLLGGPLGARVLLGLLSALLASLLGSLLGLLHSLLARLLLLATGSLLSQVILRLHAGHIGLLDDQQVLAGLDLQGLSELDEGLIDGELAGLLGGSLWGRGERKDG